MSTAAEAGRRRRAKDDLVVQVVALVGAGGQFGGPTTVATGLAVELARRSVPVRFFALRQGRVSAPAGLSQQAFCTFPARRLVPRTGMLGLFNLRLVLALWSALGHARVAHVHAGRDLVSLLALALARLRAVPVVAQTHGMVRPRSTAVARAFDAVFLRLLRRAVVLYLTPEERDELRQQLGARADLRFLGNGLVVAPAAPAGHRSRPRVVFASRLHPVKGVGVFIDAAHILVSDGVDADFEVYGPDQGDLPLVRQAVSDPTLGHRLRYGGALDHQGTLRVLLAADVVVLPSSQDWMPMILLEAMAAGVPTVSTWSCGLAQDIAGAEAGLVVEGTAEDVADAVRRLIDEPELAGRMGRQAVDLVLRRFSVERVVDELLAIYAES